jgi:hypothetical protein
MAIGDRGTTTTKAVSLGVAVTIGATLMAGCSADGSRPAASPGPVAGLRDLTFGEHAAVQRIQEQLVGRCMRKSGFPYWPEPVPTVPDLLSHGYVLTDIHWAEKYGYGKVLDEQADKARLTDRNTAYANKLSKGELSRYNADLFGTPANGLVTVNLPTGGTVRTTENGCQAEATRRLYGDLRVWFRAEEVATNLTPLYAPDILKDPRFRTAVGLWSACMRARGHRYANPQEIRQKLPVITAGPRGTARQAAEVKLAVSEATCATSTPLAKTAHVLEGYYRAKKLQRYRGAIATYQRLSLSALSRAKSLAGTLS